MKKIILLMLLVMLFAVGCDKQAEWEETVADAEESLDGIYFSSDPNAEDMNELKSELIALQILILEDLVQEIGDDEALLDDEDVISTYLKALSLLSEARALQHEYEQLTTPSGKFNDTDPVPIGGLPAPEYPGAAIDEEWEGECVVGLYIDETGEVRKAWIIDSTGRNDANENALTAALSSTWNPGTKDGKSVARQISVTFRYEFNGSEVKTLEGAEINMVFRAENISAMKYEYNGSIENTGEIDLDDVELRISGPIGVEIYDLDHASDNWHGNTLRVGETVVIEYLFYGNTDRRDGTWTLRVYAGDDLIAIQGTETASLSGSLHYMTWDEQARMQL